MSHRLEKRAWAADDLPLLDKFVLIYLARVVKRHDGCGINASMAAIAKAVRATGRGVQNAVYRLIGAGYLERVGNANEDGRRTNLYRLVPDRLPVIEEPTNDVPGSATVIPLDPTNDVRGTHEPRSSESIESIKEEMVVVAPDPPPSNEVEVWQAFNDARADTQGEDCRLKRPRPADLANAQRFLEAGASVADCKAVFLDVLEKAKPGNLPASLAYFRDPIARHIAERSAPVIEIMHAKESRNGNRYRPHQRPASGASFFTAGSQWAAGKLDRGCD